jgi:VIT1/CCC1 family predicted Fe2+/Mn2+ transporter
MVNAATMSLLLDAQRTELTEFLIYTRLSRLSRDPHNRDVLRRIGADERNHHDTLKELTGRAVRPRRLQLWWITVLARTLGLTFALKLMERGEEAAQHGYGQVSGFPEIERIQSEEEEHEHELLAMLRDQRLEYAGSMVLGLNDALVELTGALAGLTLALANARLVAVAGLVTGIAASLSMAASEYLASKSESTEESTKNPATAAIYTGLAYITAVVLLITPFFVVPHLLGALACTLGVAVAIIALFTGYISVAKDLAFWPRFWEMALISLGVAAVSFGIGWVVRSLLGVEV